MTTTEATKTVGGRPITGEISYYSERPLPEQKELTDGFIQKLDEMFAKGATHVKWEQYTPYFNDGDPCNFGLGEWYVKLPDTAEDAGADYGDGWESSYDLHERFEEDDPRYSILDGLGYQGGFNVREYYIDLNKVFGDPATVIATPEGFNVEFYDHE